VIYLLYYIFTFPIASYLSELESRLERLAVWYRVNAKGAGNSERRLTVGTPTVVQIYDTMRLLSTTTLPCPRKKGIKLAEEKPLSACRHNTAIKHHTNYRSSQCILTWRLLLQCWNYDLAQP
jgi:hypothetical protein